jgi:hypothetical protein
MIKNITEQVNSFLSTLKTIYSQQGQAGKILFAALFLLAFCCLCAVPIGLIPSRSSPTVLPSPILLPSEGIQPTPTPLFNFDFPTFTPFPTSTLFVPTAFPTFTPLPTETQTPTQAVPTATIQFIPTATDTLVPTATATQVPPTATATSGGSVVIVAVDKAAEYVEIQNLTQVEVNLRGWRLVSETGNQSCDLRGTLQPNQVLRIWSRRGNPGFDCRFSNNIWRDNEPDPAVLYNPQGEEVSRYP